MAEFTLHHHPQNVFGCAVRMAAATYGVKLNLVEVDLEKDEHPKLPQPAAPLSPENQIPTLVADDGWTLTETGVILQYLANAFGNDETESLYPKDARMRALVDQRLSFEMYKVFCDAYYGKRFINAAAKFDRAKLQALNEKIEQLEQFLSKTKYAAGDHLTIADFSIAATVAILEAVEHKLYKFPKVRVYLDACKKEIPSFQEINAKGLQTWVKDMQ